jgi:hypothetical protein
MSPKLNVSGAPRVCDALQLLALYFRIRSGPTSVQRLQVSRAEA